MHDKQFIICTERVKNKFSFDVLNRRKIKTSLMNCSDGLYILYENNLRVIQGTTGVLLGLALQGDAGRPDPEVIINQENVDIINEYETWNGRWVLLYGGQVHMDAFGTLGIFYGKLSDDEFFATSSMALAVDLLGEYLHFVEDYVRIDRIQGMTWYFAPDTQCVEIKRLLPSQIFSMEDGAITFRNTFSYRSYGTLEKTEIYDEIYAQQKNALNEMVRKGLTQIEVSLSAGYDSRFGCATLYKVGIPFASHTFEREKNTAKFDDRYPPKIARILGSNYRYIPLGRLDNSKVIEYCGHTFYNCFDADFRWHYPYGQLDSFSSVDIYIKGGYFEMFTDYFGTWLTDCDYSNTQEERILEIDRTAKTIYNNPLFEGSLKKYCDWVDNNPIQGISWADRFCYEQLMGCWESNINQGLDLALGGACVLHPINSMRISSLIESLPYEERAGKKWQKEYIERICPSVASIPYNTDFIHSIKKIVKDVIRPVYRKVKSTLGSGREW